MQEISENREALSTTFSVPDITCSGCANAIGRVVGALAGVTNIAVDVTAKIVTVRHSAEIAETTLLNTLDRAGFPASVINTIGTEISATTKPSCSCCQTSSGVGQIELHLSDTGK